MKKAVLALPLLAMLPLSAQSWEVGAFVGQQSLKSLQVSAPGMTYSYDPDPKTVIGVRVARSLVDLGPVLLQATAGYQPAATHTLKGTFTIAVEPIEGSPSTIVTDTVSADYKTSHYSVGAMFTLRAFVSVGAGLECRFEKIQLEGVNVNYTRPWGRVNVGVSLPTPFLKPFIGLEVAVPLMTKTATMDSSPEDKTKAMAPKLQVGVYGGIRF